MAEWICESCIYYPPSSCDGKPCTMCDTDDPLLNCYCENEPFKKLQKIAKDEFCVSIVRADDSKTSQMLLDELNAELKHMKDDHIKE